MRSHGGRATLGRQGDARRDEQRGVAVVLSPGAAEDPLSSLLRCDAHRVDDGVAIRVGQGDAGAHALDQYHDGTTSQGPRGFRSDTLVLVAVDGEPAQ